MEQYLLSIRILSKGGTAMKKLIFLLIMSLSLSSCAYGNKTPQTEIATEKPKEEEKSFVQKIINPEEKIETGEKFEEEVNEE